MEKLEHQAREFGTLIVPLMVDDLDVTSWPYKLTLNNGTHVYALTVIVATGSTQGMLGIRGRADLLGRLFLADYAMAPMRMARMR